MARTCSLAEQQWEGLAEAAHYHATELAKLYHRSVRQLRREFQRELGRSPRDWLNDRRILAAKQLLLSGEKEKNVAPALGFQHVSYFCYFFKARTGMTPGEFIAHYKKSAMDGARQQLSPKRNRIP